MAARITAYLVALIVAITFIAGLIVGAQRDTAGPVDLIVVNGSVYTADEDGTMAEAVAVQGNKILLVGSNREVQRLRRPQTVVVDARGGAVLPGFNDAHAHVIDAGLALLRVDLLEARTVTEIESAIKAWVALNDDREWVTGRGWSDEAFATGQPNRQLLDAMVPDRPAFLVAADGQTGWANSAALAQANITRRTPNPPGGLIVKDPRTGEPTGILKDAAIDLVTSVIPPPTREERLAALRAAIHEAHRRGITSVQHAGGSPEDLELFDELRREQGLKLRVYAALNVSPGAGEEELDALDALKEKYGDDPLFKSGAVKLVLDDEMEPPTLGPLPPDAGRSATRREPQWGEEELAELVTELDRRGWQVLIHANSHRTVRMALDAFAQAAAVNEEPARGRRHRIEHVDTIDPDDVSRFGALGVIASVQPARGGLLDPAEVDGTRPSPEPDREERSSPYRTIRDAGGRLAFGSDWPAGTPDPLEGLHAAVNRSTPDGAREAEGASSEALPLTSAIDAYTRDAAWAAFDEHRKGSLERDMLADIVILTGDIFAGPSAALTEADVATTIFDGKVVYSRSSESDD